jgi:MFS family permease
LASRERIGWTDKRILPFVVFGVLLGTAGSFPIQSIGFFFIDVLKISDAQDATQLTGIALMVSSMAALFAQLVIVQRFKLSAQTLIRWGIGAGFVSYLILIFGFTYGQFVFGMLLSGLSGGLIRPGYGAAVSLAVPKEHQGAAAGMTGGATASGFIFAPLIGNWLYAYDPHLPYVLGAALMIVMALYVALSKPLREATRDLPEETDSGIPKS